MAFLFLVWLGTVTAVIVTDEPIDYTDPTLIEHTNKLTGEKYMDHRYDLYIDAGIFDTNRRY